MKRTFEETISLLIGAIIISIGIVLITFSARAEDTPASEKKDDSDMKQTGAKQGDATIQREDSPPDVQVIVGHAEETERYFDKENGIIKRMSTLDAEMHRYSSAEDTRQILERVDITSTTILTGNAEMHRYSLAEEYVGFLKADKMIFIIDKARDERLLTIAMGNVEFFRDNIYITSDYAHQDHKKNRITFESEDKDTFESEDKDKGKVKITDVRISVNKLRNQIKTTGNPDKFRDEVKATRDVDKVYTQARTLSLFLLKQIADDQKNEILDAVWTSVFIYDLGTGNQIAKDGVKFYFTHLP